MSRIILTLFFAVCVSTTLALTRYQLPNDYTWQVTNFLESLHSDSISKTDIIMFLSPILRGSVERHDRELMSAIVRNYFSQHEELMFSKSEIVHMLKREELEAYCNEFALKMYRHLVELYDIENDITEDDFQQMIEDPELYGLIWEDYLIMTENIDELLLETEYDVPDLEKAENELVDLWESFDAELLAVEKTEVEDDIKKPEDPKAHTSNSGKDKQSDL